MDYSVYYMAHFTTLNIWQKSIQLSKDIYAVCSHFPKSELFGLVDQIKRSSNSVSANIAEGEGRGTLQENIRFLSIARGSLMETLSHLFLAKELGFVNQDELSKLSENIEGIGKMIRFIYKS